MLLNIQNLSIKVDRPDGKEIVRGLDLAIERKSLVGLVGGSGSGKTTTGLAILRLLDPGLRLTSGRILLDGKDLLTLPEAGIRAVRGKDIAMVFQEPLNAFNPVLTIGYQIEEVLSYHLGLPSRKRRTRVRELLRVVGISEPDRVAREYPHRLSGGMRQRAMLAQGIAANPRLIIADEPTSNLDVTLQARIMELFLKLRQETGVAILLITHDLGVVRHLTERVAVMNRGMIVETGRTVDVLSRPQQPYTRQLMEALDISC